MNSSIKKLLAVAAVASAAAPITAQNTYSGYFLENYLYRYQMNPSFGNETNFAGFPALGNLNIAFQGNLHVKDVLYNIDGRTCLFTNPAIGAAEAMDKFKDKNRLGAEMKINLLNGGFKAWGGYNTIGFNLYAGGEISLPKSFFSLLKEGVANKTYSIEDLGARLNGYAEIALGHSRDIKQVPGLRVGGTLKFILGMINADADFSDANLRLGENDWTITSKADLNVALKGAKYKTAVNKTSGVEYVDGISMDGFGVNGFGLGLDLGANYQWNDFNFSLAFLDLGFISWSGNQHATTNGTKTFNTDKYEFDITGNDKDEQGKTTWDHMKDDLAALYQLEPDGKTSRATSLATTMNIGVDYALPYYRRLHFGLLNTTRMAGAYSWTSFRLSANVMPVDCFSASANVAVGTFGWDFGWMLNLRLNKGLSLFVGMDHTLGKLTKYGIPLNSNAKFNFGLDFPF